MQGGRLVNFLWSRPLWGRAPKISPLGTLDVSILRSIVAPIDLRFVVAPRG